MSSGAESVPAIEAEWISVDGSSHEVLRLRFESGGWTADGIVTGPEIQYAIRLDEHWQIRQFLLFRDLEDPDLWLGTDGGGRWGEVNGSHRPDLDGCSGLHLACTPFTNAMAINRLGPLHVGDTAEVKVAVIDPETLAISPTVHRYTRLSESLWQFDWPEAGYRAELEVDERGLVLDHPGQFQRVN